jgi:transcriptional regulator with XRE-family HTH domain
MLFIAENLKSLRKGKDLTQEEVAEMLSVSPQSVSKWERGETLPDITLLPSLANFYKVTVDSLIGMEKINDRQTRNTVFTTAHNHLRNGDINAAVDVYSAALKIFPNDEGIMSDLAMAFALTDEPANLSQAVSLCERVLSYNQGSKIHHTTRAALCFIYYKLGEKDKAMDIAGNLPHTRESREKVRAELSRDPYIGDINAYLRFIAIGEDDHIEQLIVRHGPCDKDNDMDKIFKAHKFFEKYDALRKEIIAEQSNNEKLQKLPHNVMGQTYAGIPSGRVIVICRGETILEDDFTDSGVAADAIIAALRKYAQQ